MNNDTKVYLDIIRAYIISTIMTKHISEINVEQHRFVKKVFTESELNTLYSFYGVNTKLLDKYSEGYIPYDVYIDAIENIIRSKIRFQNSEEVNVIDSDDESISPEITITRFVNGDFNNHITYAIDKFYFARFTSQLPPCELFPKEFQQTSLSINNSKYFNLLISVKTEAITDIFIDLYIKGLEDIIKNKTNYIDNLELLSRYNIDLKSVNTLIHKELSENSKFEYHSVKSFSNIFNQLLSIDNIKAVIENNKNNKDVTDNIVSRDKIYDYTMTYTTMEPRINIDISQNETPRF